MIDELSGTVDDDRAAWLEWRRSGLGASDVAAVLGISRWASPYTVWLDKSGQSVDDDSEAMEAGRMLEPAIAPWFTARTGLYVCGAQTRCTHPDHPWALATVDGFVAETEPAYGWQRTDPQILAPRELLGLLEIKTTSDTPAQWADDGIPAYYAAQAQWQMFVTGLDHVWFAVLHANRGLRLRVYELARDDEDVALLVDECSRFWHDHVLAGRPPAIDGHPATTDALKAMPAAVDEHTVELDDDPAVVEALRALPAVKAELDRLAELRAMYENRIRAALGDAWFGRTEHARSVSWKAHQKSSLDTKAIRENHPRIAKKFTTTTTVRTLRITPNKETTP